MAKKPQSISILGEQLLGEARQRNTDRENKQRKREKKAALIEFGMDTFSKIGSAVLKKKNDAFLQQEGFYAKNAIFQSNLKEDQRAVARLGESTAFKGGQDAYFNASAKAVLEALPEHAAYKAKTNANDYDAYMYTAAIKLAGEQKKNTVDNAKIAQSRLSEFGANPELAYKNEALKGRSSNMYDAMTMPIVNLFAGNDSRTTQQAIGDNITDKGGIGATGKVDPKVVKSIFETSGNYTYALQDALEIEEYRKTFGEGAQNLRDLGIQYGEFKTLDISNGKGGSMKVSVRQQSNNGVRTKIVDAAGQDLSQLVADSQSNINQRIRNLNPETVQQVAAIARATLTPEDKELSNSYIESLLPKDATAAQITATNLQHFGKVEILSKQLYKRFKGIEGFDSAFATQWANQQMVENIRLGLKKDKYFGFGSDAYNSNYGLLSGDDLYSKELSLMALSSLRNNSRASTLLVGSAETPPALLIAILSTPASQAAINARTPLQQMSAKKLSDALIDSGFITAPAPVVTPSLTEEANNAAKTIAGVSELSKTPVKQTFNLIAPRLEMVGIGPMAVRGTPEQQQQLKQYRAAKSALKEYRRVKNLKPQTTDNMTLKSLRAIQEAAQAKYDKYVVTYQAQYQK